MSTIAVIADLLDAPAELGSAIDDLARSHSSVGVRVAHFAPMRIALMVTLAETLGEEFTPELQAAWHAAYDHFTAHMIDRGGFETRKAAARPSQPPRIAAVAPNELRPPAPDSDPDSFRRARLGRQPTRPQSRSPFSEAA